jgi:anti-sigma regulatory factor (Ser/Thr protein kinase)
MMRDNLTILARSHGPLSIVEVSGDLDVGVATRLLSVLAPLAETGVRVVVCDISKLAVPQQAGMLAVFPAAQRRSGPWPRSALHLAMPGAELALRLRKMGMARFVPIHATMDSALTAALADAPTRRHELALVPNLANAGLAREALARIWPDGGPDRERRQDGLIVVSELTANADRHVRRPFTTTMTLSPRRFLVAVSDQSRQEPILRRVEPSAIGGRGLQLVSALSQEWGVRLIEGRGKTVWAAVARGPVVENMDEGRVEPVGIDGPQRDAATGKRAGTAGR